MCPSHFSPSLFASLLVAVLSARQKDVALLEAPREQDVVVVLPEDDPAHMVMDALQGIKADIRALNKMSRQHSRDLDDLKKMVKQMAKSGYCGGQNGQNDYNSAGVKSLYPGPYQTSTPSSIVDTTERHWSDRPRRHCADIKRYHKGLEDGVYAIMLPSGESAEVFCDMTTDHGGWTVVQRRVSGKVNFSQSWDSYKRGFGNLSDDFWLGNDYLHLLTSRSDFMELRIDLWDCDHKRAYEVYRLFLVDNEAQGYRLTVDSPYGTAGRALDTQNGTKFSTWDRDNDNLQNHNCAEYFNGFWYFACGFARLNGVFTGKDCENKPSGITWFPWRKKQSRFYSALRAEMKIRPKSFQVGNRK